MDEYPVTKYKWLSELFKDLPMSSQFDVEMLKKKYKIKLDTDYIDQNCHKLKLKPQEFENHGGYKLIEFILDKKDLNIKEIVFYEFDDDKMTIEFSNIVNNTELQDGCFTKIKLTEEKK